MPTAWITSSELTSYLNSLGVTTMPSGIDLDDEVQAAIDQFEAETGYIPFLAETVDSTTLYDPNGTEMLDLLSGYVSITSVSVGVPLGGSGTEVDEGSYWFGWPSSPASRSQPIQFLRFVSPQYGDPGSIAVVGKRGFGSTIPQRAWNAVRDMAASSVITTHEGFGGAVKREKMGSVETEFASSSAGLAGFHLSAATAWGDALKMYRRIRL